MGRAFLTLEAFSMEFCPTPVGLERHLEVWQGRLQKSVRRKTRREPAETATEVARLVLGGSGGW